VSQINFFALGGLGEDGKNMYCLEVDQQIFVMDAGLKYPTDELYGVDAVLPDYTYLKENKNRIKGIFLSHGHEDHIGALPKLLKEINVKVYGTYFTMALLKDTLKEQKMDLNNYSFETITKDSQIDFKEVSVTFFRTTHSIPESVGMAFETKDGVIVYAPDYTFDQNVEPMYRTSFDRLSHIAGKNVLALLTESMNADAQSNTSGGKRLEHILNQTFLNADNRVIVSAFSTDIYRIQKVVNIALRYNRNIAIIGRKAQRMVDIAINLGVLEIPKEKLVSLKFIDEKNKNELKDTVVLVTGERHEPFYMLQRMMRKIDRLIHLNETDDVVLMTPPVPGTEKIAARTLDTLYRNDINIIKVDKAMLPSAHASSEDIKLMINILNPKYIVPIIGEYRHFYAVNKLAHELDYQDKDIIMLENGQVSHFENGEYKGIKESLKSGDVLVDGILDSDLSEVVLKDREILSQDGVVLVIGHLNAKKKQNVGDPEVISRGFVYIKENEELIEEIRDIYTTLSKEMFNKRYFDYRLFKDKLKEEISKHLFQSTSRRPIIIPVLIDVSRG